MNGEDQTLVQLEEDLRNFTDRDEATSLIRTRVDAPARMALPMLMFYGVGGAGKSMLASRLRQIFHQELPCAFIDFDTGAGSNPLAKEPNPITLLEIARQLKVICPRFEFGYAAMLQRLNQTAQMQPGQEEASNLEDLVEEGVTDTLEKAAELVEVAPFGIGFFVKLGRMGWDRAHLPERQKVYKAFLDTPAGRQLISDLKAANVNRIAARLISLLGEDLADRLPKKPEKACRALIVMDTLEHLRRTGLEGLQQYTEREKWIFDLWKALREPEPVATSFAQIVLLGRDDLKHWCGYVSEIKALHALEQHLLGGFSENEARVFLKKKGVSDPAMQEAILHSAEDLETNVGPRRYHILSLGMLADTVAAEKFAGITPSPATLKLPPGKLDALAERFLQSMRSPIEDRRIVRLARTPRFDNHALEEICSPDPDVNAEERKRIRGYTFIQEAPLAGWLVVHPRVREAILSLPRYSEPDEVKGQHEDWEKHWQNRSKAATDDFAGLAWFHSYTLDRKVAAKAWEALAEIARKDCRIEDHHQLTDWWIFTGVETSKNLNVAQAGGLAILGREILKLGVNLPTADLSRAIACLSRALTIFTREEYEKVWAELQSNLGSGLSEQGGRACGPEGASLLGEGVRAFREALKVFTETAYEEQWANIQQNIGNTLTEQAARCPTASAIELYISAEQAFQSALRFFKEDSTPTNWATVQNNLGNTTRDHGLRVAGPDCLRLLGEAEQAHRAALRVRTQEKAPAEWGVAQNSLGITLMERGVRVTGSESGKYLDEAETVSREALRVAIELKLPQQGAMVQDNLGNALREKGWRRAGRGGGPLLKEAVAAFHAALSVYTESGFPAQWAVTQSDLAGTLLLQGCLAAEGSDLICEAQNVWTQSLRVFTRDNLPLDWAMVQNSVGDCFRELALRQPEDRRAALLGRAMEVYNLAAEIRTRETLPQQWAVTQNNLGMARRELALLAASNERASLFEEAIRAHEQALTVLTRADLPQPWAFTIDSLGVTLREHGTRALNAEAAGFLAKAVKAHKSALEIFTFDELPYPWAVARKNLADSLMQLSAVSKELYRKQLAAEAATEYREALKVLNSEETPYDYQATHKALTVVEHGF